VIRARGIDDHGNSCELNAQMPARTLAGILVAGGWKYALLDDNGQPAGTVMLYVRLLQRTAAPPAPPGDQEGTCTAKCACGSYCTGDYGHVNDPRKSPVHTCGSNHVF
jgi:hypothetical protein